MTDYMKTRCADCGKRIKSDGKEGIEIWWQEWQNDLERAENIIIVCPKCFSSHKLV